MTGFDKQKEEQSNRGCDIKYHLGELWNIKKLRFIKYLEPYNCGNQGIAKHISPTSKSFFSYKNSRYLPNRWKFHLQAGIREMFIGHLGKEKLFDRIVKKMP